MGNDGKRRIFLKYLGVGSLSLGTAGYGASVETEKQKKKPHYGMIFDQNKCVGCSDCEIACKKVNAVPHGQMRLFYR